jgi:hypothetical protein
MDFAMLLYYQYKRYDKSCLLNVLIVISIF